MRVAKLLAVFAIAALAVGTFSAVALAGKKKKTHVVFFTASPKFGKSGKVTAKGTLNTATACKPARGMRLQVLDPTGAVIGVLAGATSDVSGNWKLSEDLPKGLSPGSSVRVKATKASAKKLVCKAGVSISVPIPAA